MATRARVFVKRQLLSIPQEAVATYYSLLDSGTITESQTGYAAGMVAAAYSVPVQLLWSWIRDNANAEGRRCIIDPRTCS